MFYKCTKAAIAAIVFVAFTCCGLGFAYQVPYDNSNVKYFYVFGEDGDPLMGAEDNVLELYVDVPEGEPGDVTIGVYDPNTGGKVDWKKPGNDWDTRCEISVYGKDLLDKKEFGADPEYDQIYYNFGPYPKTKGKKVDGFYRFKLVVKGLKGDDQNLFKVKITPNSAESFVENMTFRLLPVQGDKMYFYPQVPGGTESITVENYDLDANGGTSTLAVTALSEKYPVNDSESGQWSETTVPIKTDTEGRVVYIITKATQRYANAGLRMKNAKGKAIPIYFRKGSPPVSKAAPKRVKPRPSPRPDLKCNKFTFDATSSYDVDRQSLSYLWDFGDGETSTEPVVTHIYEKGGEYTVSLTVKDSSGLPCDTAKMTQKVYANTAPVAALRAPEAVCVDDSVSFDASGTRDDTPHTLSYLWNFGDGARGEGKQVSHTYSKGGKYAVTLTVDDNADTICSVDSVKKMIKVNTAPVADAGKDVTKCLKSLNEDYVVTFDGAGSRDSNGDALTYNWNFGDGSSGTGKRVTHTYAKGGIYKVTLAVDDGSGLSCSSSADTVKVDLNKPPVAVAGDNKKACVGTSLSFDGSGSKTEPGETLSYAWDFGDGETATGSRVSHTYTKGGKYTAVLTVNDGRGTTCSTSSDALNVVVNSAPSVELAGVKDICVGEKVSLDARAKDPDGDSLKYTWNFGDGTTAEGGSRATHVYQKGGNYSVSVTVDDGKGSACSTATDAVSVKVNTPPKAMLASVKACCVDMQQKFDASGSSDADGDSLSYTWDLGDGTTATGARVTHVYKEPGTYKIYLKVDDGSGTRCSADAAIEHIKVNAKPVAVIKVR